MAEEEDLVDYEEEDEVVDDKPADEVKKGSTYSGIHASGFRDFLLKPELLRAVVDCGFEHPSEVQHECIPQAILGMDVICQAKSGMGKTAVFVLSSLHQLEAKEGQIGAIVLCHTRELAFQINNEFERFSRYLPDVKVKVFYGGVPVPEHKRILKSECPHIIVGTPGRVLQLVRDKDLVTKNVKHFILDECDKMLEKLDMRSDVQEMMFSATLSTEMRTVCKKFMQAAAARTYGAPPAVVEAGLRHPPSACQRSSDIPPSLRKSDDLLLPATVGRQRSRARCCCARTPARAAALRPSPGSAPLLLPASANAWLRKRSGCVGRRCRRPKRPCGWP